MCWGRSNHVTPGALILQNVYQFVEYFKNDYYNNNIAIAAAVVEGISRCLRRRDNFVEL